MMRALVMDKEEWKRHIMLDKVTGLDPPGIKIRAAQGFDATDFFITGYWIWNKILENLVIILSLLGTARTDHLHTYRQRLATILLIVSQLPMIGDYLMRTWRFATSILQD
jgi:hypothetical protein